MSLHRNCAFLATVATLACSCSTRHSSAGLDDSLPAIRRFVDSFKGSRMDDVRARLSGATISEEDWKEEDVGGRLLTATFPDHQVTVFFFEGKAVTVSFVMLSE